MNIEKDDGQGTDSAEALNEGDKGWFKLVAQIKLKVKHF